MFQPTPRLVGEGHRPAASHPRGADGRYHSLPAPLPLVPSLSARPPPRRAGQRPRPPRGTGPPGRFTPPPASSARGARDVVPDPIGLGVSTHPPPRRRGERLVGEHPRVDALV